MVDIGYRSASEVGLAVRDAAACGIDEEEMVGSGRIVDGIWDDDREDGGSSCATPIAGGTVARDAAIFDPHTSSTDRDRTCGRCGQAGLSQREAPDPTELPPGLSKLAIRFYMYNINYKILIIIIYFENVKHNHACDVDSEFTLTCVDRVLILAVNLFRTSSSLEYRRLSMNFMSAGKSDGTVGKLLGKRVIHMDTLVKL